MTHELHWITEPTVSAVKTCIQENYVSKMTKGTDLFYRKANNGIYVGLVKATIVKVHAGIPGSYTIAFVDTDGQPKTKDTSIERLQPMGEIEKFMGSPLRLVD
jgi:hypothetical protein